MGGIRPAKDTVKTRVKPLTQAQESLKDQVKAHYQLNLPHPTNERLESFCFDSQGVVFSDRFTAFNPIAKDYSNQIGPYTVITHFYTATMLSKSSPLNQKFLFQSNGQVVESSCISGMLKLFFTQTSISIFN